MSAMEVKLSDESLNRLGDIIVEKILYAKARPEPWVGIDELSKHVGLAKSTIYHMVESSNMPHKSGRPLKFQLSVISDWLSKR
jgi:predicted DNA-binding transcriptional regulator AlpA